MKSLDLGRTTGELQSADGSQAVPTETVGVVSSA
jgi:hypothetical protein